MTVSRNLLNKNLSKHLQNGWIKTIKWFLGYSLLTLSLAFLFNIYLISTEDTFDIPVKEKVAINDYLRDKDLRGVEILTKIEITEPNILDRLLIGSLSEEFYLASIFFGALICWYLIKILNDLDFYHPFTESTAKRIRNIAWLLIFTTIFHFIRYAYMYWRVRDFSANYNLEFSYNTSDAQSFKYGIILFIIYKVYLYGCNLQKEQDLTV